MHTCRQYQRSIQPRESLIQQYNVSLWAVGVKIVGWSYLGCVCLKVLSYCCMTALIDWAKISRRWLSTMLSRYITWALHQEENPSVKSVRLFIMVKRAQGLCPVNFGQAHLFTSCCQEYPTCAVPIKAIKQVAKPIPGSTNTQILVWGNVSRRLFTIKPPLVFHQAYHNTHYISCNLQLWLKITFVCDLAHHLKCIDFQGYAIPASAIRSCPNWYVNVAQFMLAYRVQSSVITAFWLWNEETY